MRWWLLPAVLAVVSGLAGCASDACNGECPAGFTCDEARVACVPEGAARDGGAPPSGCTSDAQCTDPARSRCDARGVCVGCRTNGDCASGRCDPLSLACTAPTGCNSAADCAGVPSKPQCAASGVCVECLVASHCAPRDGIRRTCDVGLNRCVNNPCRADDDCSLDATGRSCETGSGACVQCLRDEQCPTPASGVARCKPGAFVCVACLSDSDCDGSMGEVCDQAQGRCKPTGCVSDAMCAPGRCDFSTRACVGCLEDQDCAFGGACVGGACASRPACATDDDCLLPDKCVARACVRCAVDGDCKAGQACVAGACREPAACAASIACEPGRTCANGACAPASCAPDALEPNDDVPAARPLLPGRVAAALCPNELDHYVLAVSEGDGVSATLTADPAQGALRLELVPGTDPRAAPLAATDDGTGRQVLALEQVPPGVRQVLVRVSGGDGARRAAYDLETRVEVGLCADDAREPDDTQGQAGSASPGAFSGVLCAQNADWLQFDVPAGDRLHAQLTLVGAPSGSASVEIYSLRSGSLRREAFGFSSVSQPAAVAQASKVWVAVRNLGSQKLRYALDVDVRTPPPANDACTAQAPALAPNASTAGSLTAAAHDRDASCGGEGGDVFYRLSLAQPSRVQVTASAEFAATLSLTRGCGTSEAELGCATRDGAVDRLEFEALPAGTYVLRVAGPAAAAGNFTLATTVSPAPPAPVNESCGSAQSLSFSGDAAVVSGSTALSADDLTWTCGGRGGDVVYALVLAQDQRVRATLAAPPGASVALVPAATCTDGTGASCRAVAAGAAEALVDRTVVPPGEWLVVVDGGSARAGAYNLKVELLPPLYPPANDACAGAVDLAATQTGDTRGAQDDFAPACGVAGASAPDAVYRLELTQDARVDLALAADFEAVLAVASGPCDQPVRVACADGRAARLALPSLPAGTYWVWVDGWRSDRGTYTLTSSVGAALPVPPNDLCAAATLVDLSQGPFSAAGQTLLAQDDLHPAQCLDGGGVPLVLDGPDVVYAVDVPPGRTLLAELSPADFDAALYALDACGSNSCLAASDQSFVAGGPESVRVPNNGASTRRVLVVVDSWRAAASGDWAISLALQ